MVKGAPPCAIVGRTVKNKGTCINDRKETKAGGAFYRLLRARIKLFGLARPVPPCPEHISIHGALHVEKVALTIRSDAHFEQYAP